MVVSEFKTEMSDPKPISINKMYSSGRNGKRFLTSEGRHFKDRLCEEVSKATLALGWKESVDAVYKKGAWVRLRIVLALEDLLNASWKPGGSYTASGEPRSRYSKKDGGNYLKIIEDAIVQGTGIDDSVHLDVNIQKMEDKEHPRVIIHYEVCL